MKKIGILSSYDFICKVNNYGSILQYYALQTFLESLDFHPFWIRFEKNTTTKGFKRKIKENLLYSNSSLETMTYHNKEGFGTFIKQYLKVSDATYHNFSDLKNHPPSANVYLVGSDQVWNGWSPERFLKFSPTKIKKISYSVSFGKSSIQAYMKPLLWYYLRDFHFISLREKSGIEICAGVGRHDTKYVVDPTFLLSKEQYSDIVMDKTEKTSDEKYIYGYFVNPFINNYFPYHSDINSFIEKENLRFIVTPIQNAEFAFNHCFITYPSPLQWIRNILDADYVVTNSFHGVAFSIILRKKFLLLPQIGSMSGQNCRYFELLEKFGLQDRVYNPNVGSLHQQLTECIKWNEIEPKIDSFIEESKLWLKNVLS